MILVVASIAVLLLAPLVARVLTARPPLASLLDAFVVVSVAGLVAGHVLPQSVALAGTPALLAFVIGMLLPALLHRLDAPHAPSSSSSSSSSSLSPSPPARARDAIAYALFLAALLVHALLDGVALMHHEEGGSALALGVILHRLPVGLALWVVLLPRVGPVRTGLVAATYIGGTLAGAWFTSSSGTAYEPSAWLGAFQALVAGSILHVVTEAPVLGDSSRASRLGGVIGACAAALLVLSLGTHEHPADAASAVAEVHAGALPWVLALAPAYLVGIVLVGAITAFAPARFSSLLGPIGHVVPALALTLALLSPALFLVRTLAVIVATALSLAVVGQTLVDDDTPRTTPRTQLFTDAVWHAVDHTLPWVCAAVFAATVLGPLLPHDALALPNLALPTVAIAALTISAGALIGVPFYVCAAGVTPLVAALALHGLPAGAAMAFMITGPALSIASLRHIRTAHGARAAVATFAVLVGTGLVAGVVTHVLALTPAPGVRDASASGEVVSLVSAVVVAALLIGSLVRQGVRGFVEQVLTPAHALEDAHVHGPSCAHDHGASRPPFSPARLRKGRVHAVRVALPFDPRPPS